MTSQQHETFERHISEALEQSDLTSFDLWRDLDVLSTHTHVEGIDVPMEGIVLQPDGRFSAVMNLYLLLQFGRDDDEGFSQSESFVASVEGRLHDGKPVVERSSVDTSDYYQ